MKKPLLIFALILVSFCGFSQFEPSSWRQIESNPENLKTIPFQYEKEYHQRFSDSLHSEFKTYTRYLRHWHNRIGIKSNGEYSYNPYIQSVLNYNSNPVCNGDDPANWELVGPYYHPKQQQGLFQEVLHDPDYPEKLLASTNHGGIWKYNPDNDKWYPTTDDLRIPGVSANDLLRNPFDANMIFAATGNGQWRTDYGVGLLVSTDRGESWTVNQSFINHTNNQYLHLVRIVPDPMDNNPADGIDIYVASKKHIYKGLDNGQIWQTISIDSDILNGQEIMDMEITNNGDILIGTLDPWGYSLAKGFIFRNNQWQEILQANNHYGKRVKFSTPHENLIFAVKDNMRVINEDTTKFRSLYKSTNAGISWTMIKQSIVSGGPKCEIEYSHESNRLYIPSATGMTVISPSTGNNIHSFISNYDNFHADVRDIHIVEFNNGIEKIMVANDGGITEANFNVNTPSNSFAVNKNGSYLPCNNVIGLAVSNSSEKNWFTSAVHQGTFSFANNILISNKVGDGEDGVYNPKDKDIYYTNTAGKIYSSLSGLVHYSSFYTNRTFLGMRMEINPKSPELMYFGLKQQLGIYNESTQQATYSTVISTNLQDTMAKVGPIAFSKDNDIYIAEYEGKNSNSSSIFMVSYDEAHTWLDKSFSNVWHKVGSQWVIYNTLSGMLGHNRINGIACNPENNDELWIAIGRIKEAETMRVLHSTDGGNNWYDYSEGLPEFPAIDFLYHYETETLFLGTDAGVFYRHPFNDKNGEWACFSQGLPVGAISELDINECSNELYVSMQSRSVFVSPIPFPAVNSEATTLLNGMNINNPGTVWNSSLSFNGDVYIAPGADLTINADCYFSERNKIVVLPGGKLTVNGKLSNLTCSGPWQGIQVSGNSNQPQHPNYQGLVYLGSNAIIKNAVSGIATYQFDSQGNEIPNTNGGIIKADGAQFINNRISCEIKEYNYSFNSLVWQTEINNCKFYTNGGYYTLFAPHTETPRGIEIVNNKTIKIENNHFSSNKPLMDNWSLYPYGILKYNSQAIIKHNEFIGLSYGIFSRDYYPGTFVDEISQNTFSGNIYGVYENGVSGSQIYLNTFRTTNLDNMLYSNAKNIIGVYKNSCTNYMLEENNFYGNMLNVEQPVIGLLVNNGGSNDQIIYNNDFEGFDYAILAQGSNRNASGTNGLSFKCNDLSMEHKDISVSAKLGTINNGIATSQGSGLPGNTSAAGNLFNNINYYQAHFWNLSDITATVTYHHHNVAGLSDYWQNRIIPGKINTSLINGVSVTENVNSYWSSQNSCPSNSDKSNKEKQAKLESSGSGITSTQSSLKQLVDAGNTPAMKSEMQTAQSNEAYQLQTELLNSSPYLSNEVLQTATNREEVLSNPLIRDVLVANPQSAKNEEVLELIENRSNPMPEYMKEQIKGGQAIIGAKEQMEARLHEHKLDYNNALSMLMAEYSNESGENYSPENLEQMLATAKNKEARYQLAAIRLQQGNSQAMATALNSVATDFDLTSDESQELSEITSYFSLVNQFKTEGRNSKQLTESEIAELTSLYENSENKAAVYARNLLLTAGEIEYEAPVIFPDMENKSALITNQATSKSIDNNLAFIQVYPNPAKDYIIFEYDITANYDQAHLNIYQGVETKLFLQEDLKEKQNSLTIRVKDWPSGIYLASIHIDGKIVNTIKFTVLSK